MTKRRRHLIIMGIWGIVLIAAVVLFRNRLFPDSSDVAAHPVQIQADERNAETLVPSSLTRLVGRWRRHDGGYILDIKAVHDDGKIDATYLNPRSIHVSKAEAITRGGHVIVAVTLQDRGYPGNMYTLTYDPHADRLEGVYHHRGLGQQFAVEFTRLRSAQNTQE
jgi:hypothetical protein